MVHQMATLIWCGVIFVWALFRFQDLKIHLTSLNEKDHSLCRKLDRSQNINYKHLFQKTNTNNHIENMKDVFQSISHTWHHLLLCFLPPHTRRHRNSNVSLDSSKAPCQLQTFTSRPQTANIYFPLAMDNIQKKIITPCKNQNWS